MSSKPDRTLEYLEKFEQWLKQGSPSGKLISESWFRYFTLDYMKKHPKKGFADKLLGRISDLVPSMN